MQVINRPLFLNQQDYQTLFTKLGPSLGMWRAAEVAALREQTFEPPVLDLGCGDGLFMSMVLPSVAVGLDPDAQVLQRAQQSGLYGQLEAALMEQSQVADGSIATVISNSVLEHILPIDAALCAAARKLKPGGRLVFTAPSDAFSRWLALPFSGYAARRNRHYQHLNLWPVATWREHLNAAGFAMEQVRPYLKRRLVMTWDVLELMQRIKVANRRPFGMAWRRIPQWVLAGMAQRAAQVDLSSREPGGGRLIVARKVR